MGLLIVDDNATFLQAARELVQRHRSGVVVDTAPDARAALLAIKRRHYDVVVSDIRLPDMLGLEVLAECRRIRPESAVIMITGYGDRELEQQAVNSGAYAFLHKPVAAEAFCAAVDRAALHSRSQRDRDDAYAPDFTWYINAAEAIHRRSKAITAQAIHPLIPNDADLNAGWAEEQAERIIDSFVDDDGSDDLLKLKDQIVQVLCLAYSAGKRSALPHRRSYKIGIRPDMKP